MHGLLMLALALAAPSDRPLQPIQATTAFDGTWSGTGTLTQRRGRGTACGADTMDRRFTIQGGQINFDYDTRSGVRFNGPIQANGSFDVASGANRWQGQVSGSEMTATYTGPQCIRTFQMHRRRN